jgi:hypothetical protein
VALFLAALITLTGCPTEADDDDSGGSGAHRHSIYGTNVSPYQVQDVIDAANAANETVYLQPGLTIKNGHINFKDAKVYVVGVVSPATIGDRLVINAADARVTFGPQGRFSLGDNGHYIYPQGTPPAKTQVDTGNLVEFKNSLETIQPTATAAAVRNFKLGTLSNYDYSTDSAGINARITAKGLKTLYVIDTLTIPTDGKAPGQGAESGADPLAITALKTVDVLDTPADSSAAKLERITLGTSSTLTSTKGNVTLTFDAADKSIPNVKVEQGREIKFAGLNGVFTIEGRLTGPGTLEVGGTLTDAITIGTDLLGGGDGDVKFTGTVTGVTAVVIWSTGKTTFDTALTGLKDTTKDKPSYIAGDVVFSEDIKVQDGYLTLKGNVSLKNTPTAAVSGNERDISLNASVADKEAVLILGAGKTISVGGEKYSGTGGTTIPWTPIVTAAGTDNLELTVKYDGTASTTAVFEVPKPITFTNSTSEDALKRNASNKLTLKTGNIEITSGNLQVVKDATFEILEKTVKTKIPTTTDPKIGFISAVDGGRIALTSTNTADANKANVDIGDAGVVITWVATSANSSSAYLAPSDGTVTLGSSTIEGDTTAATLAVLTNSATIKVDSSGKALTIRKANINLNTRGLLSIGATGSKLILTDGAKLSLAAIPEGSTAVPPAEDAGFTKIGVNAGNGTISGNAVLNILSSNLSKTPKAVSLAHDGVGASVNVTTGDTAATLNNGSVFIVP